MEIKAAMLRNFRQFNILERIAQFVCNDGISHRVKTAAGADRASTSVSELEFRAKRGKKMFHGMFHGHPGMRFTKMFHGVFHECFTQKEQLWSAVNVTSHLMRETSLNEKVRGIN